MKAVIVFAAVALISFAPAPQDASVDAPEVAMIGATNTAGSIRLLIRYGGFPHEPNIDMHSKTDGVSFENLEIDDDGGAGHFRVTVVYAKSCPRKFQVEVLAHDGTLKGGRKSMDAAVIQVARR